MPEGKIRVSELAQTLGVSSAKLITLLGDLGVRVGDPGDLVDAGLESRLKGIIRRPTMGGRGMAAARPEPTWLRSLRRPKQEEPEAEPEEPAPAAGRAEPSASEPAEPKARPIEGETPAVKPAAQAETETSEGETAEDVVESGRPAAAPPIKRRVAPREEDTGETSSPTRTTEKGPGPTLPSGRTPTPPPPPPPVRRGGERPAASGARSGQPLAGPSRTGAHGQARPGAAPVGRAGAAPGGAGVGPAGRPSGRRPGGTGPGPREARPGDSRPPRRSEGGPGHGPSRPYAGSPGGPGGPSRGAAGPGRRGPGAGQRDYGTRPGGPGGAGRSGPGRPPAAGNGPAAGKPGATGGRGGAQRRDRRGTGGVPSRGKSGRGAQRGRGWQPDEEAERRIAARVRGHREEVKAPEAPRKRATEVTIDGPITVRDLADRLGMTGAELIKALIRLGVVANLNQVLDPESARLAVSEMGITVHTGIESEGETAKPTDEMLPEEEAGDLVARSPVVTVMGHVDHGKTSLLDAIRESNVTAGEAGGITQHIGASTVNWNGKRIVFLDTPGHEAFTAMRARGAQVTDVAVLVVAADDGVMPQTLEAINHAKAAKVPIVVALNKIDKDNALPDRVKTQLGEHGLTPEDWGGDTVVVPVSAKSRQGIDDLLDMIILVAEMAELKANPDRRARGIVIETRLDKGLGPVASILVQTGTLRVGDPILVGTSFGRVRAMTDDKGKRLEEAGPSTPVEVTGLDELPEAGDIFMVLADEKMAREIAANRDLRRREQEMGTRSAPSLDDLFQDLREGERKQLNLVLKADVQGSLEALRQSFEKLEEPEVGITIIHTGVGGVTETDVNLASASDAIIIAFNVTPDAGARQAAERQHVDIRTYRIIYEAIGDVKAAIKGLRAPTFKEVVTGHAEVRQVFRIPKVGSIAGCYVTDGRIARKNKIRVVRDGVIVHDGAIASLKHLKDDVRDIASGFECGIGIENFQDIKEGDVLEAYTMEEVQR